MGERDRAEKRGHHREYWSARAGRHTALAWGRIGKWITHRRERAAARREEHREMLNAISGESD